jgi:addiction module RelE/StbE family toxin
MRSLIWSAAFVRAFKRAIRRRPELRAKLEVVLQMLVDDPFHPTLRSHKLKGQLVDVWACTVDYDCRVLFEFVKNQESEDDDILLLTVGKHDEVY